MNAGRGTEGQGGLDGGSVRELKTSKGARTVQLYSAKGYSHSTVYVYSKRLAYPQVTIAYRGTNQASVAYIA